MSDRKRPGQKKSASTGISAADSQALSSRLEALEELVKEHFDEKNQWNGVLRNWIGKPIIIDLITGRQVIGCLLWVDRYTIGLKDAELKIVHKAAIAVITLTDDKDPTAAKYALIKE